VATAAAWAAAASSRTRTTTTPYPVEDDHIATSTATAPTAPALPPTATATMDLPQPHDLVLGPIDYQLHTTLSPHRMKKQQSHQGPLLHIAVNDSEVEQAAPLLQFPAAVERYTPLTQLPRSIDPAPAMLHLPAATAPATLRALALEASPRREMIRDETSVTATSARPSVASSAAAAAAAATLAIHRPLQHPGAAAPAATLVMSRPVMNFGDNNTVPLVAMSTLWRNLRATNPANTGRIDRSRECCIALTRQDARSTASQDYSQVGHR
jgi:hypothetical protein